jgi:hypothetical protein
MKVHYHIDSSNEIMIAAFTFISNAFSLSDRNHDIDELSPQEEKFPKRIDSLIQAPALAHL